MPSTLTWIDHDVKARERSLRILALFQERESRDELGLGSVRDSFSDALFPGTSTIQTRLRYMLFVPWVYQYLETRRVHPPAFAAKARQIEMALVEPLLENADHAGVFGRVAGKTLKRLPSSVYWSGLESWGIRHIPCSLDEYHRHVDEVYHRRDTSRSRHEDDGFSEPETITWHPRLPGPPEGFPDDIEDLSFQLSREEADFLLDRIVKSQGRSLLAHLVLHCAPAECDFPWQHPDLAAFSQDHRELLDYAEYFSSVMHGASFLYNLMLAEQSERQDLRDEHRSNLAAWKGRFSALRHGDFLVTGLWDMTVGRGHTITRRTKEFVSAWVNRATSIGGDVLEDEECRRLVRVREQQLKGGRSRFTNARALDQWSGYAGMNQMGYRWSNVKTLLADLHDGLNGGSHAES